MEREKRENLGSERNWGKERYAIGMSTSLQTLNSFSFRHDTLHLLVAKFSASTIQQSASSSSFSNPLHLHSKAVGHHVVHRRVPPPTKPPTSTPSPTQASLSVLFLFLPLWFWVLECPSSSSNPIRGDEMSILMYLGEPRHKLFAARKYLKGVGFSSFHTASNSSVEHSQEEEVGIALGSNVGDRLHNFKEALKLMRNSGINITRHACLYETAPAYVTDQPRFIYSAVRAVTKLGPHELLSTLKRIEKDLGRTDGMRIWERPFVMAPLMDLLGSAIDSDTVTSWNSFSGHSRGLSGLWEDLGSESLIGEFGKEGMYRVMPVANGLLDWSWRTSVMGILNVTPDSFSDGGHFQSVESAVSQVRLMISEGADMIDIGALSTRPMASRISAEEELGRLIPVLEAVVSMPEVEGKLISVDTFYSEVASEAVSKGAHFINDVSAGKLDSNMFKVMADLNVPYVAMHMRGDPSTMQNSENLKYDNVCEEISSELYSRVREAEMSGIPGWRIMIDPGVGFSKKTEHNLDILMGLPDIREEIASRSLAISHAPMLIGPSRKRFLGEICSRSDAAERDPATIASVTAGVLGGANIVRVHNVKDNLDAVKVCDAILRQKSSHMKSRRLICLSTAYLLLMLIAGLPEYLDFCSNNSVSVVLCHVTPTPRSYVEHNNAVKAGTKKHQVQCSIE
ncbi:Folate synthesis bifunctional protein, mitochondrial [Glycine soja]